MQSNVRWQGSKLTDLLCGGAGGLDGGLGEGDLNGGQMWRQRVGDALHDVAHLGTAADRDRDVLGHVRRHFGDLLKHHRWWAWRVGPSSFARLLILIRAADTLKKWSNLFKGFTHTTHFKKQKYESIFFNFWLSHPLHIKFGTVLSSLY